MVARTVMVPSAIGLPSLDVIENWPLRLLVVRYSCPALSVMVRFTPPIAFPLASRTRPETIFTPAAGLSPPDGDAPGPWT